MKTRQLEHQEINNEERKFPIAVICDNITSPENVGMIFRISEAMGVDSIYLCGDTPSPDHKRVKKTSRSTEKNVHVHTSNSTLDIIRTLKNESYTCVALEVTSDSSALSKSTFSKQNKLAIVLGNEQHGVADEVLQEVDSSIDITMFGKNTSINVVNSLSIALYEITKQLAD